MVDVHPQMRELEAAIGAFIGDPNESELVILEPDSHSQIKLEREAGGKRRKSPPQPYMHFELTPDQAVRADVARSIGFKPAGERLGFWQERHNRPFPLFRKPVGEARQAAADCVRIMAEVFEVGDCPWLWVSPVDDPDQWPDPLPRPEVWPPP